jgi:hypothetical protein
MCSADRWRKMTRNLGELKAYVHNLTQTPTAARGWPPAGHKHGGARGGSRLCACACALAFDHRPLTCLLPMQPLHCSIALHPSSDSFEVAVPECGLDGSRFQLCIHAIQPSRCFVLYRIVFMPFIVTDMPFIVTDTFIAISCAPQCVNDREFWR